LVNGSEVGLDIIVTSKRKDLEIEHAFFIPHTKPYLEETITVRNTGPEPLSTPNISLGFSKALGDREGRLLQDLENCRMVAVPCRREVWFGRNGEYIEYSLRDLLTQQGWYRTFPERIPSDKLGSEGWAWTGW
jgi:hypothetical protein